MGYALDKVQVEPKDEPALTVNPRQGNAEVRRFIYRVVDRNFGGNNRWEFQVLVPTTPSRDSASQSIWVSPIRCPKRKLVAKAGTLTMTFASSTLGRFKGKCYGMVALPFGNKNNRNHVKWRDRSALISKAKWLVSLRSRWHEKSRVDRTGERDRYRDKLVVVYRRDDHAGMIRLFVATKIWTLVEGVSLD
jgi:hypothetical protein